jgi:hypothetical protein
MPAVASFWWDADAGTTVSALLYLQFLSAVFMTGLIWFVQIVHYPLFGSVGGASWPTYHAAHCRHTGNLVLPVMLVEIGTAAALLLLSPALRTSPLYSILCALLGLIWLSTALLQAPLHHHLRRSPGPALLRRLLLTNWIRTTAWTLRSLGLCALLLPIRATH